MAANQFNAFHRLFPQNLDPAARFHEGLGAGFPTAMPAAHGGAGIVQQPRALSSVPQSLYANQTVPIPTTATPQQSTPFLTSAPPHHISPYTNPQRSSASNPSFQSPMAAPPVPPQPPALPQQAQQPPPQAPSNAGPQSQSQPQPPQSPRTQARERERISLLLEINRELLQEVLRLQAEGKGGDVQAPARPVKDESNGAPPANPAKKTVAAPEYTDSMRRLQANLSYLVATSQKPHSPQLAGPAIMSPPPSTAPPALTEMYTRLQALFPGWKGQLQQSKASPTPQGGGGGGGGGAGAQMQGSPGAQALHT